MSLLELRNQMKRKKPGFIRQDPHKKRLKKRWVKPRGLHAKNRLKKAGHPKKVSNGYGSPREVRGLSREGLKVIMVYREEDLKSVDKEKEGIIVTKGVGLKNKLLLLKKAKEQGIKVLNLNADEFIKKKEEQIKEKLEQKKEKKKEVKKEEVKKKKEEVKLEEKLSEEEKKEKEKKEKDKLLTKREI